MSINTQFPVAVHILALVAIKGEDITSEMIAISVNTNPVVIRRINAALKKANLINIKAGVGGIVMNFDSKDITLLDIYNAVKASPDESLFSLHNDPNMKCLIGSKIHEALSDPFCLAQKALEDYLEKYTLFDVVRKINSKKL